MFETIMNALKAIVGVNALQEKIDARLDEIELRQKDIIHNINTFYRIINTREQAKARKREKQEVKGWSDTYTPQATSPALYCHSERSEESHTNASRDVLPLAQHDKKMGGNDY